jgi:hypothetical protein
MKIITHTLALSLLALATVNGQLSTVHAQGTAFTYQGRLNSSGAPANGSFDLTFTLFNTNATGVAIAGPVTNSAVAVSNGLFTMAVDFGAGIFTGSGTNWLEIAARTNGNASFSTLAPRQQLTPTPYAVTAENLASVVQFNTVIPGQFGTVGGGSGNTATNAFCATVGGGLQNTSSGPDATVGGGAVNISSGHSATVAGGEYNVSSGEVSTVGGGEYNVGSSYYTTVAGGYTNIANGYASTVGGGFQNTSSGSYTIVAGGNLNNANGSSLYATISGGYQNNVSGWYSTVPGGELNTASGNYSLAAGYNAQALHAGSFVWADDSSSGGFASTAANQFSVRAAGGMVLAADIAISGGANYHHLSLSGGNSIGYLYGSYPALGDGVHLGYNYYYDALGVGHIIATGGGTSRISVGYNQVEMAFGVANTAPNSLTFQATASGVTVYGTFNNNSDRNAKQDFAPISAAQILDKVLQLPVSEWSYKVDAATRHIGPMAQDFTATFNIGTDDKHIAPIDEGGVALAAIQGLNQKVEEKDAAIQQQSAEIADLKTRLEKLEQLMTEKLGGAK